MRVAIDSLAWVVLLLASACNGGGGGGGGDDGGGNGDGASMLTCYELADQLRDLATNQISDACQTKSECSAVGFPVGTDGVGTCNCGVSFAQSCGGIAINVQAWSNDPRVQPLMDEWTMRCVQRGGASGAPDLCDCSWEPASIDCINNRCFTAYMGRSCFPPPADAAVD
jgi:hypothetical protein